MLCVCYCRHTVKTRSVFQPHTFSPFLTTLRHKGALLVLLVVVCVAGFLLGLALLVSLTSGFTQRCRRLICASYHPEREQVHTHLQSHDLDDASRPVTAGTGSSCHRARGVVPEMEKWEKICGWAETLLQVIAAFLFKPVELKLEVCT